MTHTNWHGKPYYSLDAWCKNTLQHKCYKVALNAHMTCPNRDGHLGTRGCIFCSAGGSGDFAVSLAGPTTDDLLSDVETQLAEGLRLVQNKISVTEASVIAYFQAYTNTYAPVSYLEQIYSAALSSPMVCGISIATRPDCLGDDVLKLLCKLQSRYPDKFIWVELGLQTIHEQTAIYIRRGYPLDCFEQAVKRLHSIHIPCIVHVILGLPGETREQMLQTVSYLNRLPIFGIKLQLLHVLQGTDLAADYAAGRFDTLSMEEYLSICIACLERLRPDIVIHRVTGDGPKNILIAPLWSGNKRLVLNTFHGMMKAQNAYQGKKYEL